MNAIKLCNTKDMPREEWLAWRRKGIGGSDAAALCGLNRYKSAFDVYADKLALIEEKEMTEPMRFGIEMEYMVAKRFCEETSKKVRRLNSMLRHNQYDWMQANLDRVIIGENALLECKTAGDRSPYNYAKCEHDPAHYVQCQHYMAVTGIEKAYLAIYQRATGLHVIEIERDEDEIKALIEIEKAFWENHILTNTPPEPDGSNAAGTVLKNMFPYAEKKSISLRGLEIVLRRRAELIEQKKKLESEISKIDQTIQHEMSDAEIGDANGWHVSWANVKGRSSIDAKALQKDHPDIYIKYLNVGNPSRRFSVSKIEDAEDIAI